MWCAAAEQPMGCLSRLLNGCFEIDQQAEAEAGRPSVAFRYGRSLLAGGERKKPFFAAAEIEVYQLRSSGCSHHTFCFPPLPLATFSPRCSMLLAHSAHPDCCAAPRL